LSTAASTVPHGLLQLLRNRPVSWPELGMTVSEFLSACDEHDLRGLIYAHLRRLPDRGGWPAALLDELTRTAREDTAREMLSREEIAGVIDALARGGVRAVVLKGTALAYTVYETPIARPRLDTDLIIDARDEAAARTALEARGYIAPPYCADLFSQFEMMKTDELGGTHVVDVHWRISAQPVFAGVLTYEGLLARAVPAPALGASALTPCGVDALLLACIHPVMHHQNAARVLWVYDIHLLASRLSAHEFLQFARRATEQKTAAVCAHQLRLAEDWFGTAVPAGVCEDLLGAAGDEPSAAYLASERTWRHEAISSVRALPRWRARARWLREVLLPGPAYMLGAYGLRDNALGPLLLPALYMHRNVRGAWKVLTGKK